MFENSFYGDNLRWFIARVVAPTTEDPLAFNRVKIRIEGIHSEYREDIDEADLPWAQVVMPASLGGSSGMSATNYLQPGSLVFGFFLDGTNSQLPLILGYLGQFEVPSQKQRQFVEQDSGIDYEIDNVYEGGTTVNPNNSTTQNRSTTGGRLIEGGSDIDNSTAGVNQRRFAAMDFFVRNLQGKVNNPLIAAAGIVGNLEGETSTFDPALPASAPGEIGQGIAQWNDSRGAGWRLTKLRNFSSALRLDPLDFNTQLLFILHELNGTDLNYPGERGVGTGASGFKSVFNKLVTATTYEGGVSNSNSTWVFLDVYENPANKRSKLAARERFARRAYTQYTQSFSS